MARCLVGTKSLSEPMLGYSQLGPNEHNSVKYQSKFEHFIQENAFENVVWKMASILSRPQVLNQLSLNFFRGPIGNSSALIHVVAWYRTDATPFPKSMMTCHHLCKYVNGLSTVSKISQVKPTTSVPFRTFTPISVVPRGHTFQVYTCG